ncbi:MAG: dicarboxylate/amino acid:cation symporter [Planctomycetota bacterium]|nr:dicarboxylate/amino acid:cation symporter [Planctomycetota bacterium]
MAKANSAPDILDTSLQGNAGPELGGAKNWLQLYFDTPLYVRILVALLVGLLLGVGFGPNASILEIFSKIILRLLGAIAPPLILVAVVHVLMTSEIPAKSAGRLIGLLLLNTTVAILIGLTVANAMKPGTWAGKPDASVETSAKSEQVAKGPNPVEIIVNNIPKSLFGPLGDQQNVIGIIIIALAFGVALRKSKDRPIKVFHDLVGVAYDAILVVLHWVIQLVPIGVLCIVASVVGTKGFAPFKALGAFVVAVIVALLLQSMWYLIRIRILSWARPLYVLKGMRDSLVMAFSTASSTATMPVTYACLREKVGLREQSASLGSLVGANFNNDGTALYEAIAALFVAQLIGVDLSLYQQVLVILTSIVASVGAAGIPEAGLVTMTLVFTAVGLPVEMIALLLTVDWFLDRCRTTINVLGDVNVACILDGKTRELPNEITCAN